MSRIDRTQAAAESQFLAQQRAQVWAEHAQHQSESRARYDAMNTQQSQSFGCVGTALAATALALGVLAVVL